MTTSPWPRVLVAQRSDPGREPTKQINEDACHYQETQLGHLLVVCDGMGGHTSGREASHVAVRTIFDEVARAAPGTPPADALRHALRAANRRVWALGESASEHARPGSTCVAVLVHPCGADVAHVGDSRVYLARAGQIWPLTRDHSMVQQMVDAGLVRPEDAAHHPDANKITRALGLSPDVEVELRSELLLQQTGDVLLLCSDGVTDVVSPHDLLALAAPTADAARAQELCDRVVHLANTRGGPDNITIMAGFVLEAGLSNAAITRPMAVPSAPELDATVPMPPVVHETSTSPPRSPNQTVPLAPHMSAAPGARGDAVRPAAQGDAAQAATGAPKRPGAGGTVPLAIYRAQRARQGHEAQASEVGVIPRGNTPSSSNTLEAASEGGAGVGDRGTLVDELPAVATPRSRRRQVIAGLSLAAFGVVLIGVSLHGLLDTNEAPPPLTETEPSAGGSVRPQATAAPSASGLAQPAGAGSAAGSAQAPKGGAPRVAPPAASAPPGAKPK